VLFAMLTGQPPFTGHSGMAVMRRKLEEDAPQLDSIRLDLPPALTALVAELLDRDPARRPQSARNVHERLNAQLTVPGTGAQVGGPVTVVVPAASASGNHVPVVLPRLGERVTEGTVTRWLKHVGDSVQADEPLLEVSTDKVDTEIPSPATGTLTSITVGEDQTVPVGATLATITVNRTKRKAKATR
jgi:biotin carboxyl carrier protein